MAEVDQVKLNAIAKEVGEVLERHYGKGPMAAALVWYREEDQLINVVKNADTDTTVALLADAIKITVNLKQPQ